VRWGGHGVRSGPTWKQRHSSEGLSRSISAHSAGSNPSQRRASMTELYWKAQQSELPNSHSSSCSPDAACPISTGGGTRRVRSVRGRGGVEGRLAATLSDMEKECSVHSQTSDDAPWDARAGSVEFTWHISTLMKSLRDSIRKERNSTRLEKGDSDSLWGGSLSQQSVDTIPFCDPPPASPILARLLPRGNHWN